MKKKELQQMIEDVIPEEICSEEIKKDIKDWILLSSEERKFEARYFAGEIPLELSRKILSALPKATASSILKKTSIQASEFSHGIWVQRCALMGKTGRSWSEREEWIRDYYPQEQEQTNEMEWEKFIDMNCLF